MKPIIEVKNVSKRFVIPHHKTNSLKLSIINFWKKKKYETFYALKNISFSLNTGDFFGIIGKNGSGKSTLLKIIAGIYQPTHGKVIVRGDISPFLELGIGFNSELSGRDNIYLNGAVLGLTKQEIDKKFEKIVDFAGLYRFIDQKLKNYSSGMRVRLAFSVAIQTDASILLVDEVLAVGDADFQKKCFGVFEELKKKGKTVVFVSHNINAVKRFCDKAILIEKGRNIIKGDPTTVSKRYENQEIN